MTDKTKSRIKQIIYMIGLYEMVEATVSEKMTIQYTCARCRNQNEVKTRLSQTCTSGVAYLALPDLFRYEEKSIAQTNAKVGALNRFVRKKNIIQNSSALRAAHTAHANCCCAKCGHQEPWAKLNFHVAPAVVIAGLIIGLILILLAMFGGTSWKEITVPLLVVAAFMLLAVAVDAALYWIRKVQTAKLPPESLPRFVFPANQGTVQNH